jgi:hypothetical protein
MSRQWRLRGFKSFAPDSAPTVGVDKMYGEPRGACARGFSEGDVARRRKRGEACGQHLMASGARPRRGERGVVTSGSQGLGIEQVAQHERAALR